VSLLGVIVLCFATSLYSQDDNSGLKETLNQMNEKISKAMLDGDNETMLSLYADDAISMPSYSPVMKGKEVIKTSMDKMKNSKYKYTSFNLHNTDIITEGDLVCDIGTYELTMEMEGMEEPYNDIGKYITVYQKQCDGSLKIKAEMWNTDHNPWMEKQD